MATWVISFGSARDARRALEQGADEATLPVDPGLGKDRAQVRPCGIDAHALVTCSVDQTPAGGQAQSECRLPGRESEELLHGFGRKAPRRALTRIVTDHHRDARGEPPVVRERVPRRRPHDELVRRTARWP